MSKRPAQIRAVMVEICCPCCDCPQPNEDGGAENWTIPEFAKRADRDDPMTCVSCDQVFRVLFQPKAQVTP